MKMKYKFIKDFDLIKIGSTISIDVYGRYFIDYNHNHTLGIKKKEIKNLLKQGYIEVSNDN